MNIEFRLFHGPSDWGWVTSKVPLKRVADTCGLIAVNKDTNETIGAAVFDNFLFNSAQVTIIMDSPMLIRHGFLDAVHDFIFVHHKKTYCYSLVADSNVKSKRLCEHLGSVEKMRIPDGFGEGDDFIVYQLHCEDWYLSKKRAA